MKRPPTDARGAASSVDVAKPTPRRENMTLSEILLAAGAEQSTMLRDSPRKTTTTRRASTSIHPGSGGGARGIVKRKQGDRNFTNMENVGPDIQELQEQFKADVIKGDKKRLRDQIAKRQNARPLPETRVVEYYRPTTLVDSRRVLGAKVKTETTIPGASAAPMAPRSPGMGVRPTTPPQSTKLVPVPDAAPVTAPLIDLGPPDLSSLLESMDVAEAEASVSGKDAAEVGDSDEPEDLIQF